MDNKIILFCISLLLGFGLVKVLVNLVNPPFGWDNLNYHFTFPVEWLKNGNLENPITVFDDPSPSYYPINGSLYFLWLTFPFKSVFLADLGQLPFFILAFLAVYSLAKKLNLSSHNAFLSAVVFTLIPNYFKQTEIAYVDVMVAALFLVCVNYLFILDKEFTFKYALLYGISLGLMLGTKTIALPYSILLFLPFFVLSLKHYHKFYLVFVVLLAVFIWGGFSYLRNFLETANPFYPLNFKLFGRTIFKGVMNMRVYRAHFRLEDYRLAKLLFHEGLGLQSVLFILPAIFLALPVTLIKRKKTLSFILGYFLLLPLLLYLAYRYVIPLANTRYLYALLGIGVIAGFYLLIELFRIPQKPVLLSVIFCSISSLFEIAKYKELIASIAASFLLFFLWPVLMRRKILISFILLSLILLAFLEEDYRRNEFHRYKTMVGYSGFWPEATEAWEWLNANTQGNNIAYAGRPVPFPLYGTNFKNNVYYVSVNKTEPAKLHYFPSSHYAWGYDFLSLHKNLEAKGNYRSSADYWVWVNNLIRRNTDYLFVYSLHQTENIEFPLEDKWVGQNPEEFHYVFANQFVHIYRIRK